MHTEGHRYIRYGGFDISVEEFYFFVVTNWLLCNYAENNYTRIVLGYCGTLPDNLSVMPDCVRNVHHISHLLDYLAAVDLTIPLVASMLTLVMTPRR